MKLRMARRPWARSFATDRALSLSRKSSQTCWKVNRARSRGFQERDVLSGLFALPTEEAAPRWSACFALLVCVRKEQLLAADLVVGDRRLSRGRDDPVGKLLRQRGLHM